MGYKRPESVLVVLYNEHHQILVMQRKDDAEFWQSVTGTIEENELPVQTAYREVMEETGIVLSPETDGITDCQHINTFEIRPQWQYRYPPGVTTNKEFVFTAQISADADIVLTEHTAYEWVDIDTAVNKVWSPSNKEAILAFVPRGK